MYLINAVVLKHTPTALCEGGWDGVSILNIALI